MSFIREFSISSISNIFLTLFAFLNNIIITRQLEPSGRGQYAIISNIVILLSLLLGEGIRKSNTILLALNVYNIGLLLKYTFITITVISVLFSGLIILGIWQAIIPNLSENLFVLSLIISVSVILSQSFQSLFLGLKKIYNYNWMQMLPTVITFLINLIGIHFFNFGVTEIIFSLLVSNCVVSLGGFKILLRLKQLYKKDVKPIKNLFSISGKSTLAAALIFLLYRGDVFIINYFLGTKETGIYAVVLIFSEIFQRIPNIAGPLLVTKTLTSSQINSIKNISRFVRVSFAVNFLLALILIVFGEHTIISLFGYSFEKSYEVLLFFIPALIIFGPGSIIYSYFVANQYPPGSIIINFISAILNFVLNLIFTPLYGLKAAAIICSITYALWTLLYVLYFTKVNNLALSNLFFMNKEDLKYILSWLK